MNGNIEVLILPVADVDRALAFYTDKAGFTLDVDYAPTDEFRVVQMTAPGSGCSGQAAAPSPLACRFGSSSPAGYSRPARIAPKERLIGATGLQ